MKTTILKQIGTILLLVTTVCFSVTAQKQKQELKPFYSNCDGHRSLQPDQIICTPDESGQYLKPHLKYNFFYDSQNRLCKKEAYKWDVQEAKWGPYYSMSYGFSDGRVEVDYAKWNKKTRDFSALKEKAVYERTDSGLVFYTLYKKHSVNDQWSLVTQLYGPNAESLIADTY